MERYDVIVIGGGHAGCEAAHAAARMGCTVGLVTLRTDDLGTLSCNPAIGGLGKGHLVREIDALDGVMGRVADRAGIQFRLLNRRKGPAVQGPRAQVDRMLYRSAMAEEFARERRISVIAGEVVDLTIDAHGAIRGVDLAGGDVIAGSAVIVTTGTFLGGLMHIGTDTAAGGRIGAEASIRFRDRLGDHVGAFGRLKTGTPPRLAKSSIAWDRLESQVGDDDPTLFSFLSEAAGSRQVACRITHTNERTHDIIRMNLMRSAMYGGRIEGTGPRYCPSIEDKVVRFSEKSSHQIFLEPEGLTSDIVYPNGISTSLPLDIQTEYVRSIDGLEGAEIVQPGYAVEYDFVDPRSLDRSLMLPTLPGLFLAGQINGTTGYEEAAAQGLVAGINAARRTRGLAPVTFTRDMSYIGVLIDDLVTRGVSEPYRMFTSRAEYRLSLRADNADSRLTPLGIELSIVGSDRRTTFATKMDRLRETRSKLSAVTLSQGDAKGIGADIRQDGHRRSALDLIGLPGVDTDQMVTSIPELSSCNIVDLAQIRRDQQYEPYLERQAAEITALKRDEAVIIPKDFNYGYIGSLSNELREKLRRSSPATLAQAACIEGMTPAALTSILAALRSKARRHG